MGERGAIQVHYNYGDGDEGSVYLYTHWTGDNIKTILAEALIKGRNRWADPSYLTRIIFNHMTRGEQGNYAQETTGYGIDFVEPDVNYPIVRVFYPPLSPNPYPSIECDGFIYRSIETFILLTGPWRGDDWNERVKDDPVLQKTTDEFLLNCREGNFSEDAF